MTKHLFSLLGLTAFSSCLPCGFANDSAKESPPVEQTTVLDPYEVTANPFAHWGMGISCRSSFWSKTVSAMHVSGVVSGSPADLAGVTLGDEIRAVDGKSTSGLRVTELKKRYYNTERGEMVTLALFNHAANQTRIAEFRLGSDKTWNRKDGISDQNCWGLRVLAIAPAQLSGHLFFALQRIVRWETVPIVPRHKHKNKPVKTEQKPVHVNRRAVVFCWSGKSLTLIERENRTVEIIEAGKVPESDDVVGHLVSEGATLTLKADGAYELKDAPAIVSPRLAGSP